MTQGVTRELQSLSNQSKSHLDRAHCFLVRDGLRRNELAVEAAIDHHERCKRLLDNYERSSNALEVKVELFACRDHAAKSNLQFTELSCTDLAPENLNSFLYAAWIHRAMTTEYLNCLQMLNGMDLVMKTSDEPVASSLNLLFRGLQSLSNQSKVVCGWAHHFLITEGLPRVGVEAARDHRDRCQRLLDNYKQSSNAHKVKAELYACRDHAEKCELEFIALAQKDLAPEFIKVSHYHLVMAAEYRNCLQTLDGMDLVMKTSDAPAASSLNLLFGTDGGQVGSYVEEYEYYEGCETSVELDSTLSNSVMAKASAGGSLFGAHVSAEAGAESGSKVRSANAYKMSKCSKRTVKITIDLSKPSYAYQLQTKVLLNTGHDVTLWGGVFFSHKLIT